MSRYFILKKIVHNLTDIHQVPPKTKKLEKGIVLPTGRAMGINFAHVMTSNIWYKIFFKNVHK